MTARATSLLKDASLLLLVCVHWVAASLIADATTDSTHAKRAVSVWTFVFAAVVNLFSVTRSWMFLGSGNGPPETIVGIFFEIVNVSNVWGSLFAVARLFSRDETVDPALFNQTVFEIQFESFVEMGLVSGGVGFTTLVPTTTSERVVTWLATYVGGVLITNMFLLAVVLTRRGFWERAPTADATDAADAAFDGATSGHALTFTLPRPMEAVCSRHVQKSAGR